MHIYVRYLWILIIQSIITNEFLYPGILKKGIIWNCWKLETKAFDYPFIWFKSFKCLANDPVFSFYIHGFQAKGIWWNFVTFWNYPPNKFFNCIKYIFYLLIFYTGIKRKGICGNKVIYKGFWLSFYSIQNFLIDYPYLWILLFWELKKELAESIPLFWNLQRLLIPTSFNNR